MPYTVDRSGNNSFQTGWPVVIPDGQINSSSTSLKLIGKGVEDYGEFIAENFVALLENFANTSPPNNPITGQLWYDADPNTPGKGTLKVYSGNGWNRVDGVVTANSLPASGNAGDVRYIISSNSNQLYVHDGVNWRRVAGLVFGSTQPSSANSGDFWYDSGTNNLKVFINSIGWLVVNLSKVSISYNSNTSPVTIASSDLAIVDLDGSILSIYSKTNIASSSLPVSYTTANGTVVNLQTLFPNGLLQGLNFANNWSFNIVGNNNFPNSFKIINQGSGTLELGSNNNIDLIINNLQNKIESNLPVEINATSHIKLPTGTTAQRPSSPNNGDFRYNSTTNKLEYFDGVWQTLINNLTSSDIPPGTAMLFYQATAPVGWTQVTTNMDNRTIRVTGGVGGSLGGSEDFSNVFKDYSFVPIGGTITVTVNGTALTINQLPPHGHPYRVYVDTGATSTTTGGISMANAGSGNIFTRPQYTGAPSNSDTQLIGGTGGGQTHTHTTTVNNNLYIGADMRIKYINVIVCTKD